MLKVMGPKLNAMHQELKRKRFELKQLVAQKGNPTKIKKQEEWLKEQMDGCNKINANPNNTASFPSKTAESENVASSPAIKTFKVSGSNPGDDPGGDLPDSNKKPLPEP